MAIELVATGQLRVEASGELARIPVAELTLEDIAGVNGDAFERHYPFSISGEESVLEWQDELRETLPVPSGKDFDSCERTTTYRIEWYVGHACLADFGVRKLEVLTAQSCCYGPGDRIDCS